MKVGQVAILVLLLVVACVNAQIRSYTIESFVSDITLPTTGCYATVTEVLTVTFTGQYSFMGRPIPNRISYGTTFGTYRVSSNDVSVTKTYWQSATDGNSKALIWDFVGLYPGQTRRVTFTLSYTVSGLFQALDNGDNRLNWSYQWGQSIGAIGANVYIPTSNNITGITATPAADATITTGRVSFNHGFVPANLNYDISVALPSTYGNNWTQCKPTKTTLGQKIIIIIAVVVIVSICICLAIVCSILGAIRRMLWGPFVPYGGVTVYDSGYYQPTHSHGYHHHHNSNSGHVSSYSGSSGFAG